MRLCLIVVLTLMMIGHMRPAAADFDALMDETPVESCEAYFAKFPEHFWNEFLRAVMFRRLPINLIPLCYEEARSAGENSAAQFRFATSLYGFGYSDDAVEAMRTCSDAGVPMCQTGLGLLLINGPRYNETSGEELGYRDPQRAFKLFLAAAQTGSLPAAAYAYLTLLLNGFDGLDEKEVTFAFYMYVEASKAGDPMALLIDAQTKFESSKSVAQDIEQALAVLGDLVERQVSGAMVLLASIHEIGQIVPQDGDKAYALYLEAANLGNTRAQARIFQAGLNRDAPFEVDDESIAKWGAVFVVSQRTSSGHLSLLNYDPDWRVQFAEYLDE
jgi:TPR repeat protein